MSFAEQQLSRWLSMAETQAKRTILKDVHQSVRDGKCLVCEDKDDNNRRGLCMACYQQFLRTRASKPKRERIEFEEINIREGRILPVGQLREIRKPNPFEATA